MTNEAKKMEDFSNSEWETTLSSWRKQLSSILTLLLKIRQDDGLYVISHAIIQDLQVVVDYENDVVVDGQNYFVSENAELTYASSVTHDVPVEAMQKASSWKSKV